MPQDQFPAPMAASPRHLVFTRLFTQPDADPLATIEFAPRHIRLDAGSKVLFEQECIFPTAMSDQAARIIASKYLRRAGVPSQTVAMDETTNDGRPVPTWLRRSIPTPNATTGGETDIRQVYRRMTGHWTYTGWHAGLFPTEEDALTWHDEVLYSLAAQMAAPNSPQWFNTGHYWAYGLTGAPQGHWFAELVDDQIVSKPSTSAYEHPQVSACYITKVEDDLVGPDGIMDFIRNEARIFKFGSGSGSNVSRIRAEGEPLSGGGRSSGLMSFLRVPDRSAGSIKSGGTTRRAAKMVILDVDHPDVIPFVDWKSQEEHKVAALAVGSMTLRAALRPLYDAVAASAPSAADDDRFAAEIAQAEAAGVPPALIDRALVLSRALSFDELFPLFTADWNSEAYETVSGQNSNNSIMVTDQFLGLIDTNDEWPLIARTTGKPLKHVLARDLWQKICRATWASGDPGLTFDGTIEDWNTCTSDGRIRATNPCAEFVFHDLNACTLASLRLTALLANGQLDVRILEHLAYLWTIVLDLSVTMGQQPNQAMAEAALTYRTIGLGPCDVGGLLLQLGIAYDSHAGRTLIGALQAILGGTAQRTSAQLARRLGAFPAFTRNAASMKRVIGNHVRLAHGERANVKNSPMPLTDDATLPTEPLTRQCRDAIALAREIWSQAYEIGITQNHGYRNAQVTVVAPTGTIGLAMDAATTGLEPEFSIVKLKSLAGGGMLKMVNAAVPAALARLGYTPQQIERLTRYIIGHGTLAEAPGVNHAALKSRGLSDAIIQRIEAALAGASEINQVFSRWTLGDETLAGLGFDAATIETPGWLLLPALGFSDADIQAASDYACGHGHLEGAPDLRNDDLPVFDCANKAGNGSRYLSVEAHVRMMSAAQAFVSGGISKTVNLPSDSPVDAVDRAFRLAYTLGIKAIALYRDGSKLSQPVTTARRKRAPDADAVPSIAARPAAAEPAIPVQPAPLAPALPRGVREPISSFAYGFRQKFRIAGVSVYFHTGEFEDGRLAEIFITLNKSGDEVGSSASQTAAAVSLGLQHGVPLSEFVDKYVGQRFEPAGQVELHPWIKWGRSYIDVIFRTLAIHYLGAWEHANVQPPPNTPVAAPVTPRLRRAHTYDSILAHQTVHLVDHTNRPVDVGTRLMMPTTHVVAAPQAPAPRVPSAGSVTSTPCTHCGQRDFIRSGTCLTCCNCGTPTGGCS